MKSLTPFKRFIGCKDCQQQWAVICPLCKMKGEQLKTLDGKSQRMTHYKFIKKVNDTYFFKRIINNPPKKQVVFKSKKKTVRRRKSVLE